MRYRPALVSVLTLLALSLVASACGGGGGGRTALTSASVYGTAWFRARELDSVHRALMGTFVRMTDGRYDLNLLEVDGTVLRADDTVIPYEFIRRGQRVELRHATLGLEALGAESRDGQFRGFAKLEGGSLPGLQLLVPRGTPSVGSVGGTWRLIGAGGLAGNFNVYDGTIIFNGSAGTYQLAQASQNGSAIGITEESSGNYRVDAENRLIIERGPNRVLMGHVSESGMYAVLAGEFGPGLTPTFYLLMRDHPSVTRGSVAGEFSTIALRHAAIPAGFTSTVGYLLVTGQGTGLRTTTLSNREGTYVVESSPIRISMSWAVGSDGALRVNRAGIPNARGFVSPSNAVVALVNDRGLGTQPFLELWIRLR